MMRPLRPLLLLLLLATVVFYVRYAPPPREAMLVQRAPELPAGVPPEGELLGVVTRARPATLQIEIGSGTPAFGGAPLGVGTGFFISEGGLVLTAYHVVNPGSGFRGEAALSARGPDGRRYGLDLVGFDAYLDLALLQADLGTDAAVPYLPLAPEPPRVGGGVVAIGNSRNDFLEARAGEVRRLDVRAVQARFADGTFELSAALAPGDSGGPVLDEAGNVVGVVSYIAFARPAAPAQPGLFPLLGLFGPESDYSAYAVPVEERSEVVAALRAGGRRDVPVIGFQVGVQGLIQDYDPALGLDLGPLPGVVVGRVVQGGPAARAGLRDAVQRPVYDAAGALVDVDVTADVIVSVDGERTPTYDDLVAVLRRREVGERVTLKVARGDAVLSLELELGGNRAVFNG